MFNSLACPVEIDCDVLERELLEIKGVVSVQSIQIWALTQRDLVASIHLIVSVSALSQINLLTKKTKHILSCRGISQSTIEAEAYGLILP
jgi:Co/Zn/Cd efflux system component